MPRTLECRADDAFTEWLAGSGGSLLVSAYDANAVLSIGYRNGQVHLLARRFDKPMGLAHAGRRLAIATRHAVIELSNDPALAHDYDPANPGRYDALYLARASHHTGDCNIHELAHDRAGTLHLTNTRFSCLAAPSRDGSFAAGWRPGFVSALVPEDRCHLNGLALRDGRPAFVTVFAATDSAAGWRQRPPDDGQVLAIDTGAAVATGLRMPHSPRWYRERLWVLESGAGVLCVVNAAGEGDEVCRLDGYARGLAMVADVAVVGLSKVRERHIFRDLPLTRRGSELRCGLALVALDSGAPAGMLQFDGAVGEVFDVCFLAGTRAVNLLQADHPAALQAMTTDAGSYWLRPESAAD